MTQKKLTIDDFRNMIKEGKAEDPLLFLESIMNGKDPRKTSRLHDIVSEINDTGGLPDLNDWNEITTIILEEHECEEVSVGDSLTASKTLAEYLHAKKKQIEMNTNIGEGSSAKPLTENEIELFKEVWNDEF